MEITVIFPAYNEEENIRQTVDRALAALRPRFERFEILIVDDCGSDATGKIADELAGRHPEIRVRRQCDLLGVNRAGLYYPSAGESEEHLMRMRLIDEQYTRGQASFAESGTRATRW